MNIKLPIPVAIALVCGAAPLIAGSAIFIAWCASGASWLMGAGLLNIYIGTIAFGVGAVSLLCYLLRATDGRDEGGTTLAWLVVAGVILFLNFPVCSVIMNAAGRINGGSEALRRLDLPSVHVVNAGGSPADEMRVLGSRGMALRSLGAGEAATFVLEPDTAKTRTFQTIIDGKSAETVISLATVDRARTDAVVVILPDGTVRAVPLRRSNWGID